MDAFRVQLMVPEQRQLFDYWISCGLDGAMPSREAFSPAAIPRLLPFISLIDVEPEGEFRVRLAGTRLRDVFDREITGMTVAELERVSNSGYWQRACSTVVANLLPAQGAMRSPRITKDHLVQFWLRLPFVDSEGCVKQLLGFDTCLPSVGLGFDVHDDVRIASGVAMA